MSGSPLRSRSGVGDGDNDDNSDGRPSRKRAKLIGEYATDMEPTKASNSTGTLFLTLCSLISRFFDIRI